MIDLRSDTVTRPSAAMRDAMASADVGDDRYGEDPTVNRLEAMAAETTGHEAALFVSSGTQGNLLGILAHCERGDEYIAGQQAHCYRFEGGGAAVLGSVQPQPIEMEADGTLDLERVADAIKADDFHYARTRLFCLENTAGGRVLPPAYLDAATALARERDIGLHLDGARVFNAAVKAGMPVDRITSRFDTVSFCLSKGLGAPMGSLLAGSAERIARARRWRKVLGGQMRQIGIVAAAGIFALEHHVVRLAEDHANAATLAEGLRPINALAVDTPITNMVFIELDLDTARALQARLASQDIIISCGTRIRLVTHLDVSTADIETVIGAVRAFFTS